MRRTPYTMGGFCLLYLLLILLTRSGDVETNPGPNTAEEGTVSELEILKLAQAIPPSYYMGVGIALGFPASHLEANLYEHNYTNAILRILMKWNMLQPRHSSRQLLAEKLREIDLGGLSDRLLNETPIPNSTDMGTTTAAAAATTTFPSKHASAQAAGVSRHLQTNQVSDRILDKLSRHMPAGTYTTLCRELGIDYNSARSILMKFNVDYQMATRDCLEQWKFKTGGNIAELMTILQNAEVGPLVKYIE